MSWHHRISISRFRSPKPQNQLPNALTTNLALEPLEPRVLLAGLPTLIDIVAAAGASSPGNFTNVNNTVFFLANNPANGSELWKSDGTGAGTVLVKDIRPGVRWFNSHGFNQRQRHIVFQRERRDQRL